MKILDFASALINVCKTAEPIKNKSDYTRVKRWVNKATSLYIIFPVIAIITSIAISNSEMPIVVILFVAVLTGLGFATMLMNFKLMLKSMWNVGVNGYQTGEKIQTTHVNVTRYGDGYNVSTHTDNQGCAVAFINGFINLFVWAFLCVYVCPFFSFKKIIDSKKNMDIFKAAQM